MLRKRALLVLAGTAAVTAIAAAAASGAGASGHAKGDPATTTPIKHLVVVFQENVSFDHYFGTYPNATNPSGEPAFHAAADTPVGQWAPGCTADRQPEQRESAAARPLAGAHL